MGAGSLLRQTIAEVAAFGCDSHPFKGRAGKRQAIRRSLGLSHAGDVEVNFCRAAALSHVTE